MASVSYSFPRGLSRDGSFHSPCLRMKPRLGSLRWQDGRGTRRGYCVAKISETQNGQISETRNGPTLEQQEAEAREDERTGAGGYKLKESAAIEPVHLEMETVDDVVRPKRIAFNYGFQAKFLRIGPSVPGNVIKLAFENFGREWRVSHLLFLFIQSNDP
jgi:hypothetical protein